jgi:hypothetical protein
LLFKGHGSLAQFSDSRCQIDSACPRSLEVGSVHTLEGAWAAEAEKAETEKAEAALGALKKATAFFDVPDPADLW